MDKALLILKDLWAGIKNQLPAIVMAILSYEESRVKAERAAKRDVQLDLKRELNKDAVETNFSHSSDADVVDAAIHDGGGTDADALALPPTEDRDRPKT